MYLITSCGIEPCYDLVKKKGTSSFSLMIGSPMGLMAQKIDKVRIEINSAENPGTSKTESEVKLLTEEEVEVQLDGLTRERKPLKVLR